MTAIRLKRFLVALRCWVLWHRHIRPDGSFAFHCLRCGHHIGDHAP